VGTAAGRLQGHAHDALGLGDDTQSAGLADDDELAPDAAFQLVPGPVPAAHFLVGDELKSERIGQPSRQLAENPGRKQRRDLHVLRAAREQPVAFAARCELAVWGGNDVQVRVEQDTEIRPPRRGVDQCAWLAA
jgi:hypothetical protein